MESTTVDMLLVEDDEVDVINVQWAFKKITLITDSMSRVTVWRRWRCFVTTESRP